MDSALGNPNAAVKIHSPKCVERRASVCVSPLAGVVPFALMLALCGCASSPPPTLVKGELAATATVNPDALERASPVMVKVFELKSLAAFDTADFFSLFDKDKETLGTELVARDDLSMRPGESKPLDRAPHRDAKFLGFVAAFRDLEHSIWRAAVPVAPNKTTAFTIRLDGRSIVVVPKE